MAASGAGWTDARSREVLQVFAIKDAQLKQLVDDLDDARARAESLHIRSDCLRARPRHSLFVV